MKKKITTIICAILCAILSVLAYRYVSSEEFQYKRDLKNARSFYEDQEYDKALSVYLHILESKDDEEAKEGLIKTYIASAKVHHEKEEDDLAKNDLLQAMMFDGSNLEAYSLYEEWFETASYEIPVKNLVTGLFEGDSRKMFSAIHPSIMKAYISIYEENGMDEDAFYETMDSVMEKDEEGYYMIGEATPLSSYENVDYEQAVYEQYGVNIHVSYGYSMEVTIGMKGQTEVDDIFVYEIAGQWYVSHEFLGMELE